MKSNDLSLEIRLNIALETKLATLAAIWGVSSERDARIKEIRNSAQITILGRTNLNIVRMLHGSPYHEHEEYFKGLQNPAYKPRITGNNIDSKSPEYAHALKVLKDFAFYVGHTVETEQKERIQIQTQPAWVQTGLVPTENIVETNDFGRSTIPAGLAVDEDEEFRQERIGYQTVINGASPDDLKIYAEKRLKPRLSEIQNELEKRRKAFNNDETFMIFNASLVDHKDALTSLLQQAEQKIDPPVPVLITEPTTLQPPTETTMKYAEYPTLTREAPERDAALDIRANAQLAALEERINGGIKRLEGPALNQFIELKLSPKLLVLQAEVEELATSGQNAQMLEIKQRHLAIIQKGIDTAKEKSAREAELADVDAGLNVLRARIENNISGGDAKQLTTCYHGHLLPKQRELEGALANIPADQQQDIAVITKQRHLSVIKAGAVAAAQKIDELAKPQQQYAVAIPNAVNDDLVKIWKDSLPVLTDVGHVTPPKPTSRDVRNAVTVPYVEKQSEKPKSSFMSKVKTALVIAASGVVGAIAGFVMVAGQEHNAPDASKAQSATAAFNAASGQATTTQSQAPSNVFVMPERETPAPAFYEPPPPTAEELQIAEKAIEAQKSAKEDKPPVIKSVKVQKATAPSAANTNDVKPIMATTFDIAASKIDLETWNNACNYLKAQNMTMEGGVCPK